MNKLKNYFNYSYSDFDQFETFKGNHNQYWSTYDISNENNLHEDNESISLNMREKYNRLRTKRRMNTVRPRSIIF